MVPACVCVWRQRFELVQRMVPKVSVQSLRNMKSDGFRDDGIVSGPYAIKYADAAAIYRRYIGGNLKDLVKAVSLAYSQKRTPSRQASFAISWVERVVLLYAKVLAESGNLNDQSCCGYVGPITLANHVRSPCPALCSANCVLNFGSNHQARGYKLGRRSGGDRRGNRGTGGLSRQRR